jgi:hypothetical protein
MDDKPTTIQISCLDCGCQEELELFAADGGYDEARDLALTRAGWEIVDDNHLRCPRCFTPARFDWLQAVFVLIGLVGTIGIGWLDDRPRIVMAYILAWGFIGGILPDSLRHRIVSAGKRDPGQWKNPGPWIGRVSYVTWVGGSSLGALVGLQEPRLPFWVWPFACFGGGMVASRVLELVRFFVRFTAWLRGGQGTTAHLPDPVESFPKQSKP